MQPFPYWEESDSEANSGQSKMAIVPFDFEPENIRPSPSGIRANLPAGPVLIEVTYTKQLTQRYKRCSDGRLTVYPQIGVAKLEDSQGTYLASADLGAVPSLVVRWNAAFTEGKGLEITKGFGPYLVYVPEVSCLIQSRKTLLLCCVGLTMSISENTHLYQLHSDLLNQGWSDVVHTAKTSELSYLEAEVDKVQARVDEYIKLHNASITIQRYYKSRHYIKQSPLRIQAATYIQRYYRNHLIYITSKPKPDLDKLASRIQHTFRLYRFRKLVLTSGLFIRTARLIAALTLKRSHRAALRLGRRWWLLVQARREKRELVRRVQSANRIQRAFRVYCALKRRLTAVALQVQLRWRLKLSRRKAEAERLKVLELRALEAMKLKDWADEKYRDLVIRRIQAQWRGLSLRRKIGDFQKRRAAALIQRNYREKQAREFELLQHGAARKLQSAFRGMTGKREFDYTRRMVVKVQAKWRRFVAVRRLKVLASDARDIKQLETQAEVLKALINKDTALYLEMLVRKCQAFWRGKVARRQLIEQVLLRDKNEAILRITAIQESAEVQHIMAASTRIQAAVRGKQVRGQFLAVKLLVTRVQAQWRGVIARKRVRRFLEEAKTLEDLAVQSEVLMAMLSKDHELYKELLVRRIQALWRAKVKRRHVEAEQEALSAKAALKIQAVWRGVNGRREADTLRQQELVYRYQSARELEASLGGASQNAYNDFTLAGSDVIVLPDDIPGLIRAGRFIAGPLKGLFLSDLPAGSLTTEEIEVYRTMTDEEVVDVDKVARVIQTAWRLQRNIKKRGGPAQGTNRAVQNLLVRSRARMMTVLAHVVDQTLSLAEAVYNPKYVRVDDDVLVYTQDRSLKYSAGFGVVVIPTPLVLVKEGGLDCYYFSVTLTDVFSGKFIDGLTIGVTDTLSDQIIPETADGLLGDTYLIGFEGHAFSRGDFVEIEFNPKNLKKGDRVGCMIVYPDGDLLYLVNDEVVAVAEIRVPRKDKFYPVIDLLGTAKQVRLSTSEKPPIISAEEPVSAFGVIQDVFAAVTQRKDAEKLPVITKWISFDRKYLNPDVVKVSSDALLAEYVGLKNPPERYVAKGVLITERIIPKQSNLLFFQVTVLEQVHGFPDGLTLGFCGNVNRNSKFPDTADGIDGDVWAAGFDGQWYSTRNGWGSLDWVGNKLREGDTVGVVVIFPAGDLLILVNGDIVAEAPLQVPAGRELYGVVDLLGATNSVRLDVEAKPPKIELNN